jgi:protease IV
MVAHCRGRYAELLLDNRSFSPDEAELFDRAAMHAYYSFRDKAALSRGMEKPDMEAVAQGRVWTGIRAVEAKLVDEIGGIAAAVRLAKEAAGIADEDGVRLREVSKAQVSPLALLSGGGTAAMAVSMLSAAFSGGRGVAGGLSAAAAAALGAPALVEAAIMVAAGAGPVPGAASFLMPELSVEAVGTQGLLQGSSTTSAPGSGMEDDRGSELFDC